MLRKCEELETDNTNGRDDFIISISFGVKATQVMVATEKFESRNTFFVPTLGELRFFPSHKRFMEMNLLGHKSSLLIRL